MKSQTGTMRRATTCAMLVVLAAATADMFADERDDWPHHGRDAGGTRHSPLAQIDKTNVGRLQVAWTYRTGEMDRVRGTPLERKIAFEATPLAIDGPTGPVTIARVERDSPAEQGGLQQGDQLQQIGTTSIDRPLDVERSLLGRRPGERVPVLVQRNGEQVALDMVIAAKSGRTGTTVADAGAAPSPQSRNATTLLIEDTVTWLKGNHSISTGLSWTQNDVWLKNSRLVPEIDFGIVTGDPAQDLFSTANFPGASSAQLDAAEGLYALLTGRVSQITADARIDEATGQYVYNGVGTQRARMREAGLFVQDAWRMRPNFTVNFGLRYDLQFPFTPLNSSYSTATIADLCGISGVGSDGRCNLFQPGVTPGKRPEFIQFGEGVRGYNVDYDNFAPSVGMAWTLGGGTGPLAGLLGANSSDTVVRAGYSRSFNRNGMNDFTGQYNSNPGIAISVNRSTGRALIADGAATTLAGFFGGSGTTTYGENIGVMAATRVYSTAAYWVAGATAILLSLSPKVGALFNSIPAGVLGGVTTALYGLIGIIGIKIWVDNRVDFSRPVNQYTAAVALVVAIAGFTLDWGDFQLGAIVLGTAAALVIYHLGNAIARWRRTGADDGGPLPAVGQLGGDPVDR